MSGPIEILLIVAAIGYVMVRRLMGEPVQAKRMLVLPGVLCVIGLSDVSHQLGSPMAVVFLVATAGISVVIGALRGATVKISARDGVAFARYTGLTVALWVANVVIKFGGNLALGAIDAKDASAVSNSLMLTLGAGMLVEGLVVMSRALRADHRVVWAEESKRGPRQLSPMLDNMRRTLSDQANFRTDFRTDDRRADRHDRHDRRQNRYSGDYFQNNHR